MRKKKWNWNNHFNEFNDFIYNKESDSITLRFFFQKKKLNLFSVYRVHDELFSPKIWILLNNLETFAWIKYDKKKSWWRAKNLIEFEMNCCKSRNDLLMKFVKLVSIMKFEIYQICRIQLMKFQKFGKGKKKSFTVLQILILFIPGATRTTFDSSFFFSSFSSGKYFAQK